MTALAAARATPRLLSCYDMTHEFPVASGSTIYHGSFVGLNAAGLVIPGGDNVVCPLGRAQTPRGLPLVGDGAKRVEIDQGIFLWTVVGTAVVRADVGELIGFEDDQDVNQAGTAPAGIIYDLPRAEDPAGSIWVLTFLGMSLTGTT